MKFNTKLLDPEALAQYNRGVDCIDKIKYERNIWISVLQKIESTYFPIKC